MIAIGLGSALVSNLQWRSVCSWQSAASRGTSSNRCSSRSSGQRSLLMASLGIYVLLFLFPHLCQAQEPAPAAPPKQAIPSKEDRDSRREEIDSIFEVSKATTSTAKAQLATRLMGVALETRDDPAARFVLLNLCREVAADAADVPSAMKAIDVLESEFEFDAEAVRIATIGLALKSSVPIEQKKIAIQEGAKLAESLCLKDRYTDASKLLTGLSDYARRGRDVETAQQLLDRARAIEEIAAASEKIAVARKTLETTPDDPVANDELGRFYLLMKQDFRLGFEHLLKASDSPLRAAVQAEVAATDDLIQQEKVADLWWEASQKDTSKVGKEVMRAQALLWYTKVKSKLKGLAAAKAELRIEQLRKAGVVSDIASRTPTPVTPPAVASNVPVVPMVPAVPSPTTRPAMPVDPFAPTIKPAAGAKDLPEELLEVVNLKTDCLNQQWERRDDGSIVAPLSYAALLDVPVTIRGDYEVYTEFTREQGADIVSMVLPTPRGYCALLLSAQAGQHALLGVDTPTLVRVAPNQLENGRRYRFFARVKSDSNVSTVEIYLDDKLMGIWRGVGSQNIDGVRKMRSRDHMALTAHKARVVFHTLKLTMLNGTASVDGERKPESKSHPLGSPVIVKKATYGGPTKRIDVTKYFEAQVAQHPFAALHADDRFFGDPEPGVEKTLEVEWEFEGKTQTETAVATEVISAPAVPNTGIAYKEAGQEFKIVAMYLGGGLNWIDLTATGQRIITSPTQAIKWSLTNENPWNRSKNFYTIWFDYQGKRFVRSFHEGDTKALLP